MKTFAPFAVLGLAGILSLPGCHSQSKAPTGSETDPAPRAAAAAPEGPVANATQDRTPAAIAAARKQAAQAAGGALKAPPPPVQGATGPFAESAATAARISAQARADRVDCSAKVQYSDGWAVRLPGALSVYPGGAVHGSAGVDDDGCALRVVNFATPVSVGDVVSFYYTKAIAAGFGAEYRLDGADHVLGGRKDGQAYVVYARKLPSGLIEVDLIASGK